MPTTAKTATIPAGQSLSNAIDISGALSVYIGLPTVWTPANVTFQGSLDAGATWFDLFDPNHIELMMPMAADKLGAMLQMNTSVPKFGQVKLRSGVRNNPIAQQQDAVFILYVIT
jgi:hypothetical protein